MNVVPFKKGPPPDAPKPHLSGTAQCVACEHRWVAVAPVGTVELQCPQCKLNTGRFRNLCEPADGQLKWRCDCGCDLFMVVKDCGYLCVQCGTYQRGF